MKKEKKIRLFLLVSAGCLLTALLAALLLHYARAGFGLQKIPDNSVCVINNMPVSDDEFNFYLEKNRTKIYQEFAGSGMADLSSSEFWDEDYLVSGKNPSEELKNAALDECVEARLIQSLALEKDLVTDIGYEAVLSSLSSENERRREVHAAGGVIYGPVEYTPDIYYDYFMSNLYSDLLDQCGDEMWPVDESILQKEYEEIKNTYFRIPDDIHIAVLTPKDSLSTETEISGPEDLLEKACRMLESGDSAEKTASELDLDLRSQAFLDKNRKSDSGTMPELLSATEQLEEGGTAYVTDVSGNISLIQCTERTANGYQPFEEVKNVTKSLYHEKKLNSYLKQQKSSADIEWITNGEI